MPEDPPLKFPEEFKLIGRDVPRKDGGKLDGTAVYTQDIHLPGQLTAVVAHPPRFGAVVRDFDATEALRLPGVEQVFAIPAGVAVVAREYWTAKKARDLVKINWDESRAFHMGSDERSWRNTGPWRRRRGGGEAGGRRGRRPGRRGPGVRGDL